MVQPQDLSYFTHGQPPVPHRDPSPKNECFHGRSVASPAQLRAESFDAEEKSAANDNPDLDLPAVWPNPVTPAMKGRTVRGGMNPMSYHYSFATIVLAQGEAFPAHFERYVRREQTTGSTPRRTWLTLADWMPLDFKSPAKLAADLKLSHVENVRQKVLADELHHQVPGEKRHAFVVVGHEFTEELMIRSDVHDAIDAKADGEPIPDDAIDKMIAAARDKALSFLVVAKTGSGAPRSGRSSGWPRPGPESGTARRTCRRRPGRSPGRPGPRSRSGATCGRSQGSPSEASPRTSVRRSSSRWSETGSRAR